MYFANQVRPAGAAPDNFQILLAEDDAMLGHLIELTLVRKGYKVVTVHNGLEALEAFQQGGFDLVLLDVNMPVMDGFTVCAELRRTNAPAPVVSPRWVSVGDLSLNFETREVKLAGHAIDVTPNEYKLLAHFVKSPNTVISRASLVEQVWGYEFSDDNDLVRVTISRLRTKIEDNPARPARLVTVYGAGYRLTGVAATAPVPVSLPVATSPHREPLRKSSL